MGSSGNVAGYKVFSFDTGVRNPQRNMAFLQLLKEFEGEEMNAGNRYKYYKLLIKEGVYKVSKISKKIQDKYQKGETLTDCEIDELIRNNPQKTGDANRAFIDIRGLKDQGFITLEGPRMKQKVSITPLGHKILENENIELIYTKAMIGLHANNPSRISMFNKSRPFLNTLFVLKEIDKIYKDSSEYKEKGILYHEFGFFVLSMKDCNYKKAVENIVNYRNLFGKKINIPYLCDFLTKEGITPESLNNAVKEYPDEVFRKFQMTGLIAKAGFSKFKYVRFDYYNREKIELILKEYENYEFIDFENTDDYVNYLTNIVIPWEKEEINKISIIKDKEKQLGIEVDKSLNLDSQIEFLDNIHNNSLFKEKVENFDMNVILNELLILSDGTKSSNKFEGIPDPLRLEWLIALLFAKKYGYQYVKPNLILNSDGEPISYAPGGRPDTEFNTNDITCLLESTMIRSTKQMENSETTSVSDHLRDYKSTKAKYAILIAPKINERISDYYAYRCSRNLMKDKNNALLPLTIEMMINIVLNSENTINLKKEIDVYVEKLIDDFEQYTISINEYKFEKE